MPGYWSACVIAAAVLSACGGGGGGGTVAAPAGGSAPAPAVPAPTVPAPDAGATLTARKATEYNGIYAGPCERADGAASADSGLPVYVVSEMTVTAASSSVADVQLRLDFFPDAACSGAPLGSLTYGGASQLSIAGAALVQGKSADKVILSLASPEQAPLSAAGGKTVFGAAVRLSVPSDLFAVTPRNTLWLLEGSQLFLGGKADGADGFPTAIDFTTASTRQSAPSPVRPSPCLPVARIWAVGASPACEASLPGSASGVTALVPSSGSLASGMATFSCSNGTWSAASGATCAAGAAPAPVVVAATPPAAAIPPVVVIPTPPVGAVAPVPAAPASSPAAPGAPAVPAAPAPVLPVAPAPAPAPLPGACVAGNVTWTVDGVSCQGTVQAINSGFIQLLTNTDPAKAGVAQYACSQGALQLSFATCSVRPPPPPLTDPLQIAQLKNCLACHSVTSGAQSVGGISMRAIADRYRGSPPAAGVLEGRVTRGSIGTFGSIPMPANPQISDAELAIVIPWILSQ